VDNKSIVSGNPLWSDNFIATQAVATNNLYANSIIDQTIGLNDSKSGKLSQSAINIADRYIWPNTCTNLSYNNSTCLNYANKTLTGLTWDISNLNLELNKNYIIKFNYQGSTNLLHPTTTTLISGQTTTPANQVSWVLGYNNLNSASSFVITTNNLVNPGLTDSFEDGLYIGSFNYSPALNQLYSNGNRVLYLSIIMGQNNLAATGNNLNIDNVSITACQNIRPDGTWCGDGIVQTNHGEICEAGVAYTPTSAYYSNINNQYGCSADTCRPTAGGYCGDSFLQPNYEYCDRSGRIPSVQTNQNNQYNCIMSGANRCATTSGGWCGNNYVDWNSGEICEYNTYVTPTPAASTWIFQYLCSNTSTCQTYGGYCGNNLVETTFGETFDCGNERKCCKRNGIRYTNCQRDNSFCGDGIENTCRNEYEECDYADYQAPAPEDSLDSIQYECSSTCKDQGGWCGNGFIESDYLEDCDYNDSQPNWNTTTQFCNSSCQIENIGLDNAIEWITVPGNSTYNTNDFEVMRYKPYVLGHSNLQSGELNCNATTNNCKITKATSTSNQLRSVYKEPFRANAQILCQSLGGHLINNSEWMTIARNIENQASNWTGGAVGSGKIKNGPDFNLSNGQIISEFSSNNGWEWIDTTILGRDNLPHGTTSPSDGLLEYDRLTHFGTLGQPALLPLNASWNSDQGYGKIYVGSGWSNSYSLLRAGNNSQGWKGFLNLSFNYENNPHYEASFRCVR
jgi:hypothetical protein